MNAVRREALARMRRTTDDLTDAELFADQDDEFWFIDLAITALQRLPDELAPMLTCRGYTQLQAYFIVKSTIARLSHAFGDH